MPKDGINRATDLAVTNAYWNPRPLESNAIRDLIARRANRRQRPPPPRSPSRKTKSDFEACRSLGDRLAGASDPCRHGPLRSRTMQVTTCSSRLLLLPGADRQVNLGHPYVQSSHLSARPTTTQTTPKIKACERFGEGYRRFTEAKSRNSGVGGAKSPGIWARVANLDIDESVCSTARPCRHSVR